MYSTVKRTMVGFSRTDSEPVLNNGKSGLDLRNDLNGV